MNNKTYYHLLLDRSGSMASCWDITRKGFQEQINAIRSAAEMHPDQEVMFSACLFNHHLEFPGGTRSIRSGAFPSIGHIQPGGNTALLDAIGESISRLEFIAANELAARQASVVMVVLTDGYENASNRFTAPLIRQEMDRTRASGLGTFSFIGVDLDINAMAEQFNVGEGGRMNISKEAMPAAFASTRHHMSDYLSVKKAGSIRKEFF